MKTAQLPTIAVSLIVCLVVYVGYLNRRITEYQRRMESMDARIHECRDAAVSAGETMSVLKLQIEDLEVNLAENRVFYEDYQKRVTTRLEHELDSLIDRKPHHGGGWFITGIRFIHPSLAAIKFEDGHRAGEAHIHILRPEEQFAFEVVRE